MLTKYECQHCGAVWSADDLPDFDDHSCPLCPECGSGPLLPAVQVELVGPAGRNNR